MSDGGTLLATLLARTSSTCCIIELLERPLESQLQVVIFRRVLQVVTKQSDTGELMCRETNQRKFLMGECFDAWEDAVFLGLPKLPIPQLQFVIELRVREVTTGCVSTGEPMVREGELCRFY